MKLAEKQQLVEKSLSLLSTAIKGDENSMQDEIMETTKRMKLMELRYKIFDNLHEGLHRLKKEGIVVLRGKAARMLTSQNVNLATRKLFEAARKIFELF